jgi:fumarate reductase flavoprotein subunit
VFGGSAGDVMARRLGERHEPDADAIAAALARARRPFAAGAAAPIDSLDGLRESLYATMWDDAGIVRDAAGLARAATVLGGLASALEDYRLPANARDPSFNLAWHDWLNLVNLVEVSQVIVAAAVAREDSRGAHFRADHPQRGDLASSAYTRVQRVDGRAVVTAVPVRFTRVRPGESLLA